MCFRGVCLNEGAEGRGQCPSPPWVTGRGVPSRARVARPAFLDGESH